MTLPLAQKTIGLLTAFASRLNGGVFEAVVAQTALIRRLGGEAVIFALQDGFSEQDRVSFGDSRVIHCPMIGPGQIGFSPALDRALTDNPVDLLHLHGIWMYPSRAGAAWAARTGRPYLISPHGMLDPWIVARGRWKKALARLGYEQESWRRATLFHALTPREGRDIAAQTGRGQHVVIPNPAPAISPASGARPPVVGYISRVHPKKNLLALVSAWQSMAAAGTHPAGARLVIGGWGADQDVEALRAAIAHGPGDITFLGPTFGEAKQALLHEARFFILPSLSEGLPMTVLEAWAAGTPTIMTRECNLDEGFAAGAALECGFDAPAIAAALAQGWACDDTRWAAMQRSALDLAAGPFSAEGVAAQWGACYASLIDAEQAA